MLTNQETPAAPQAIISHQETGVIAEKEKKKKKKKSGKNNPQKLSAAQLLNKEIDEQKIRQAAKESLLHTLDTLTLEEKQRFSYVENHPLKLICTNMPLQITAQQLFAYFNSVIAASEPQLAQPAPIIDVEFNKTRTFAILTLSSRKIKNYFRQHPKFVFSEGVTIFEVIPPKIFFQQRFIKPKNESKQLSQRIYLGGLPVSYTDTQVKKICQVFGKLRSFNLVKDPLNNSKGYCFLEYETHQAAQKAIKALNGLPIGTYRLKCHQSTYVSNKLAQDNTATVTQDAPPKPSKPANHVFGSYLISYENIREDQVQHMLLHDGSCRVPSRVIQLLNMFYPQDLFDNEFYNNLEQDIQQECGKFGRIETIVIPRPDPQSGYCIPTVGKIFVKYLYIREAKKARLSLSGRVYNKRTVVVSFYSETKFDQRLYLIQG